MTNPFPDLERSETTYEGKTHPVFRGGRSPAVIHEIRGCIPGSSRLAGG